MDDNSPIVITKPLVETMLTNAIHDAPDYCTLLSQTLSYQTHLTQQGLSCGSSRLAYLGTS